MTTPPEVGSWFHARYIWITYVLLEEPRWRKSGNVELSSNLLKKCLEKKKLQPRKCVFLDVASRAPSNQAHVPFCGV